MSHSTPVQSSLATWPRRGTPSRDLIGLLLLGLFLFAAGIGLRDPWPADEPRFALIARDMVESGGWFFPRRAGELYAHKPPLFLWSIASAYAVTGSLRFSFLLPSLLAGLATLALVYDLGRRLWHRRAGLAAGLTLLAIFQFTLQAKTAQIDASVTFWTTLGLYGLTRTLILGHGKRWWWLAWGAMGLGVITKGVGFLPLLALIPWAAVRNRGWRHLRPSSLRPIDWVSGVLIFALAISLWLVPMLVLVDHSGDPDLVAYRNEILWDQTAKRYAAYEGHQKPIWYYPVEVIPFLWLPASLLFPWLIPAWRRRAKRRDARYLWLLGWILMVVIFFTFSSGKRGVYILPAVPALALACGPLVAARIDRLRGVGPTAFALTALLTTVFLAAAAGGLSGASWATKLAEDGIQPWGMLLTLGACGVLCAAIFRLRRGLLGLALLLACLWQLYGWWGYRLLNPLRAPIDLMAEVATHLGPDGELAAVGWKEQMMLFADRPVAHWGYSSNRKTPQNVAQVQALARWLLDAPVGRRAGLLPGAWMEPCLDSGEAIDLGRKHGHDWRLVDRGAVTAACGTGASQTPAEAPRLYHSRAPKLTPSRTEAPAE